MNRLTFITGATSGIGKATAERLAQEGFDLIINGRRKDRLESLKKDLELKFNVKVKTLCFDVRDETAVKKAVEALEGDWKKITILINNAGLAAGRDPIDKGDTDDWNRMIDTNVKGLLYVSRAIIPIIKEQENGHIVNIGSTAGKETYRAGNVYCASKHAVDSITKGMRIDLLPHGIKVTGICPGLAETAFSEVRFKGDKDKAEKVYKGFEPLQGEDIADIIYFSLTRPAHVGINDIVVTPTAQANSFYIEK